MRYMVDNTQMINKFLMTEGTDGIDKIKKIMTKPVNITDIIKKSGEERKLLQMINKRVKGDYVSISSFIHENARFVKNIKKVNPKEVVNLVKEFTGKAHAACLATAEMIQKNPLYITKSVKASGMNENLGVLGAFFLILMVGCIVVFYIVLSIMLG